MRLGELELGGLFVVERADEEKQRRGQACDSAILGHCRLYLTVAQIIFRHQ